MVVDWTDLDRESYENMSMRETVRGVPAPYGGGATERLTKKQLATLVLIYQADTGGFGQIRHYPEHPGRSGMAMPSPSVPETLDEKSFASVGDRRQVSRRTGRGRNGFEKKKEGGYVSARQSDDVLDALARKLGFDSRVDDGLGGFMAAVLE